MTNSLFPRESTLKYFAFAGLIPLLIFLSACSLASDITPPPGSIQKPPPQATQPVAESPVYPIVPPDLVNGYKIYTQECAQCHGVQGMGDGPQSTQLSVPAATLGLSDFARLYSPAEWYKVVTQGNMEHFMPAFASLTARQRWDVVAYAMDLSIQDDVVKQGQVIYRDRCVDCHGEAGRGSGLKAASLSTRPTDFSDQSIMAQRSAAGLFLAITNGEAPDMPAFSDLLSDSERWALVGYLRSLTYARPEIALNPYPSPLDAASSASYPAPETFSAPAVTQSVVLTATTEISPTAIFTGSVTVQLVNGSGGDAPSDVPVTLYGFDDMQNTYSETLTTGISGMYVFSNVSMPDGRVFIAGVDYASGSYGSDIVTADPATPDLNLGITVYDTTTDVSALTTDRVHILFDFTNPQAVQVVEVFIISNSSKQAVISPAGVGTVVTFPLPQGYTNLQFQDGEIGGRYLQVDQGFADTSTVNPGVGGYTVIFAFQMPYDRQLDFSQPMFLPTSAVVVMLPDNGMKVTGDQLQDAGTLDYQGITYHKFNASGLPAGSSLEFSLAGNPGLSGSAWVSSGSMQSLAIGLGIFGLALVGTGVWLFRRNQGKLALQRASAGLSGLGPGLDLDSAPDNADTLMDAIIALDDQYSAGNLPEEAYLERRAVLKSRLKGMDQG
ncbi:MAG: c-type cytochrome [Acidobacteriaceae bacterium]